VFAVNHFIYIPLLNANIFSITNFND